MLRNYFKIALRYFIKERVYALLNILGLSIGLSVGFVSLLYLRHELSYDRFHEKSDQIYRIHQKFNDGGTTARCSYPIGPTLVDEYSQITNQVRFMTGEIRLRVGEGQFIEQFLIADSTFLDIFDVEWVGPENRSALKEVNDVLITDKLAERFFGNEDPIGKIIRIDAVDNAPVVVRGIIKEYPSYSHMKFGILGNMKLAEFISNFENEWNNPVVWTYVTIPNKESAQEFIDNRLEPFVAKFFPPDIGKGAWLPVVPLTSIHLESHDYIELSSNSSYEYLYGIFGIGMLILILAAVNYMNLTSARALNRLKEIGMRKVVGARRLDIIYQFLFEALLIAIAAMIISIVLIYFYVQGINSFAYIDLQFRPLENFIPVLELMAFTLFVTLFSGIYPAVLLSSFPTVSIIKGEFHGQIKNTWVRRIMVTFQFAIVALFLLSIFTINRQINFVLDKELGYDKTRVASFRYSDKMFENETGVKAFIGNLESHPNIESVSKCWGLPGGVYTGYNHMKINYEGQPKDEMMGIGAMHGDSKYLATVGLELLEGRNLDDLRQSDSTSVLVNETLVRQFGWEGDAIGKEINYLGNRKTKVIGVVKDFHFESLHTPIKAMSIRLTDDYFNFAVKVGPDELSKTLEFIRKEWMKYGDEWPLEIVLMEEGLRMQYEAEEKILQVFQWMTLIAVVLAVIGLLSQVSFTAEKKVKEIGIRKVLGATLGQLFMILSKETLIEILIAAIIAFPLGFFLLSRWLSDFAYRIDMEWYMFLITLVSVLLVTALSISYTVVRAALSNPVDSLRSE